MRKRLPNGLRALFVPLPNLHSVTVAVYCRSGPRFEAPRRNGISHFIEHLLFRATRRYPDSAALSQAVDAMGGDLNGATFPEHTEIVLSLHHRFLTAGLAVLGELICRPSFHCQDIERERRIILEEMAQQSDTHGASLNLDDLCHQLMWPRQSFKFSTIGSRQALGRLTRRAIVAYYRRMFAPRNLVLCMAGNFDPRVAARLVGRHFGRMAGGSPFREPPITDSQRRPRLAFRGHVSPVAHIRLCHKACSYRDPGLTAVLVLCDLLGGGTSSRLFVRLREERALVYDIGATPVMFSDVGAVEIATSTTRGRAAPTVRALLRELDLFLKEGIRDRELRTVKDRVANHMELMLDSPADLVEWFGVRELLSPSARIRTPRQQIREIMAATPESLIEAARTVFQPRRRSLIVLGSIDPKQKERIRSALVG